jgi:hypothetical protein
MSSVSRRRSSARGSLGSAIGAGFALATEYAVCIPTTPILTLRFPDGDVEHRSTRGELPVGTLIRARGTLWRIRDFVGAAAILELAEADQDGADGAHGASTGPLVKPAPLGDMPLTFEVVPEA